MTPTWSNYKHHNTTKLLIACTPNSAGTIYISSLYVSSIPDVELTHVSGLIPNLPRNEGVSVMADIGFTV